MKAISTIDNLMRHVVDNRRDHRRRHFVYDSVIYDELGTLVFRGKTIDVSRSGARLTGLPTHAGVHEGQRISVEFCIPPKKIAGLVERLRLYARVMWLDETEDSFNLGLRFDRALSA